jgi:hypothetical protein
LVIWFGAFVVLTGFAGVLAVAWHTRRRTPVLTTIAMTLAVPGFLALTAGGPYGDVLAHAVATVPGLDRDAAFQIGYGMESAPQSSLLITIFVLGHLIGTTLLGIALWRARVAPTWLAVGLTASQPIHLASVMTGVRPVDLVGVGPYDGRVLLGRMAAGAYAQRGVRPSSRRALGTGQTWRDLRG